MTPTRDNEEIEGRSYKDYAYSPVAVSSSPAVFATTPEKESVELNVKRGEDLCSRTPLDTTGNRYAENMTEKGSTLVQFLAAASGKFQSSLIKKKKNGDEHTLLPRKKN